MTLSEQLKTSTQDVHRRVEKTPFVQAFLRGTLRLSDYVSYLQALLAVYEQLELSAPRVAALRSFPWQSLARAEALRADLRALGCGPRPDASPATVRYVDRLRAVESDSPVLLAAHAYVRYLGDLSGGQILARLAQSKLGLQASACSFYAFPLPVDELKACFRSALDELCADAQEVLLEAHFAFELNEAVFLDIQPSATNSPSAAATSNSSAPPVSAQVL